MNYVRCVRNETLWVDDPAPTYDPLLVVGHVYKVAPPVENDGPEWLRVIDEEGEDYLYPTVYFEPYPFNDDEAPTEKITVHVGSSLKHILRAEAIAAQKPVSALVREWIDERLDLPIEA
ncbi:MAG: ribbon-helix-helix protein, CopG family [Caldilineaceae bacterium]|jgi:hypothetical protein